MKNIRIFLSENFRFLAVKFSVYLNRRVFVMAVRNHVCRHMWTARPKSTCISMQSDHGLHCLLKESLTTPHCMNGELCKSILYRTSMLQVLYFKINKINVTKIS